MEILNHLYSSSRYGNNKSRKTVDHRTAYQRDYDRIIFSSAFRRLQNKTQVFPLPGSVFVHNRLTHSLEVASVGRSLAFEIGNFIAVEHGRALNEESKYFYEHNLQHVIASACLCHDIGNPAFGHSGEDAIASFFVRNENSLKSYFTAAEWSNFIHFEGNANAFRILTQKQQGKTFSGVGITFSTLAAIAKYPCESLAKDKKIVHRKKFGFFESERAIFTQMAISCSMLKEQDHPTVFKRHPFVWITEAADDICYNIIDMEDAHRLGIVSIERVESLFVDLIKNIDESSDKTLTYLSTIVDDNERISYLRAVCIGRLIGIVTQLYKQNWQAILDGTLSQPLFDQIHDEQVALQEIKRVSIDKIYNNRSVIQIENAGYNVMFELLSHFVFPILKENRDKMDNTALKLIPNQFKYQGSNYEKVMGVIDYISGMTDNFATDTYRRIKGIDMGMSM